ncbi:hypothetical protein JCM10908_006112 [Rhodotorula pacifica]|uniref:uncharacterized protein n=1 Tax=Rhodotorula pacifica TaxID=1495444 RepID=UPI00317FC86F
MASLATPAAHSAPLSALHLGGSPSSPPSPPASPVFSHQQSIHLNGRGIDLAVRPGTALGSSHFASPPNSAFHPLQAAPSSSSSVPGTHQQGALDYANLPRWDDSQVANWLASALPTLAAVNNYAETFASNDIRGSVLLEVDQTALKEMGVKSVGDRVKICVAVRALRAKYNSAIAAAAGSTTTTSGTGLARKPSTIGRMAPSPLQSRVPYSPASLPSTASSPHSATVPQPSISSLRPGSTSLSYSARNISVGNRIPPPLHLAQSNVIPGVATGAGHQLSPPSATTSPKSATFMAPSFGEQALATSPLRPQHAAHPAGSAPHTVASRIPPTPNATSTNLPSPSRTAHLETSPILASAPQQYQSQGLTTSVSASSLASRPPQTYGSGHRKANSSSVPAPGGVALAASAAAAGRPPFAGQAVSYAGHPYAASATSSAASTATASSFASAGTTPSTATSASLLPSALPALPPRFASAPVLPSSSSASIASVASSTSTPLSNLDVMRKAVKFTSADGVTTRVLAVADARDGREVLARVMKKFGGREGEDLDGWGVWTTEVTGAARLLTEHELFQICQNAAAPERTRGLIVRRHHTQQGQSTSPPATHTSTFSSTPTSPAQSLASSFSPSAFINKRGRKLQWVFGDSGAAAAASDASARSAGSFALASTAATSPTSPHYLGADLPRFGGVEPASPTTSAAEDEDDGSVLVIAPTPAETQTERARTTKLNRASTVSIMSGLEAPEWVRNYYAGGEQGLDASTSSSAAAAGATAAAGRPQAATLTPSPDAPLYQRDQTYKPPRRTSSRRAAPPPPPPRPIAPAASATDAVLPPPPRREHMPATSVPEERQGLLPESTRKLRNFFGQRPPSELIATHLTEFFPLGLRGHGIDKADRKLLSKQVRASIRRSMSAATGGSLVPPGVGASGRRSSTASTASRASRTSSMRPRVSGSSLEPFPIASSPSSKGETSWEHQPEAKPQTGESTSMSRFSGSSNGSASELLLGSSSSSSARGGRSPRSSSGSALDPPDESAEDANELGGLQLNVPSRLTGSPESTAMVALASSSSSAGDTTTSAGGGDYAETRSLASSLSPSYLDPHGLNSSRLSRRLSRMSRMSGSSRLSVGAQSLWERRSRDSDVASVITVDEVTAELETRRISGVSWRASDSDEDEDIVDGEEGVVQIDPADDDDEIESDFDEEMSDDEDFAEDGADEEPGTAKPEAKGMKWIKGALIGAGSFGSVYLGMNPMTGSLMAVKQVELPTGNSHNEERKKGMLDALEREIELLKVLQHDNIVQYLDSSTDDKHLNIFLEYVPGGSVAALLQNYGAFEEALVSKFVRQILTGLEYLHEREIIHRDIKGANILVDNKGNIKISDFGISKKVEDNLLTGAKVHRPSLQGSVYWMAPEVVKQTAYTSKADIWSLGCLVVEMLTGAHPWANLTQMQAIFRIGSSSRPTVPDDISTEANDFLDQTFEIEHEDRPAATELLQHPFIRESDTWTGGAQQTPTRATFSQGGPAAARLIKA